MTDDYEYDDDDDDDDESDNSNGRTADDEENVYRRTERNGRRTTYHGDFETVDRYKVRI